MHPEGVHRDSGLAGGPEGGQPPLASSADGRGYPPGACS